MNEDLPRNIDVLIIGTGVNETILSSAFSCIGYKLLHIDSNSFYGGTTASFSLQVLLDIFDNCQQTKLFNASYLPKYLIENGLANEIFVELFSFFLDIKDVEYEVDQRFLQPTESDDTTLQLPDIKNQINSKGNKWDTFILKYNRQFNIDLTPRLLLGGSYMFKLLLNSTTSKYLEFQVVNRILMSLQSGLLCINDGKLVQVPCTRSQIFKTDQLSMTEKRLLVKFIKYVMETVSLPDSDVDQTFIDESEISNALCSKRKSFSQFLYDPPFHFTPKLVNYAVSITLISPDQPFQMGLVAARQFCAGLSSFNTSRDKLDAENDLEESTSDVSTPCTPYLYPVYGCGELPQAFCRLSAVHGSPRDRTTFVLNTRIDGLVFESSTYPQNDQNPSTSTETTIDNTNKLKCIAAYVNGQRINLNHLILEQKYASSLFHGLSKHFRQYSDQEFDQNFVKPLRYARAIIVTDTPIFQGNSKISFLHYFTGGNSQPNNLKQSSALTSRIYILQLNHESFCVPRGYFLYHVISSSSLTNDQTPKKMLEPIIVKLLTDNQPSAIKPVLTAYFSLPKPYDQNNSPPYFNYISNVTIIPSEYTHKTAQSKNSPLNESADSPHPIFTDVNLNSLKSTFEQIGENVSHTIEEKVNSAAQQLTENTDNNELPYFVKEPIYQNDRNIFRHDLAKSSIYFGSGDLHQSN